MGSSFPLVVSYYTIGTPYQLEAQRLIKSCQRFDIDHHVVGLPPRENWVSNCALKGPFVASCIKEFLRPILWLDADAEIVRYPELFDDLECDVAAYQGRHLLSGTVFFGQSKAALSVAYGWASLCVRRPYVLDQQLLCRAIDDCSAPIVFRSLPQGYCKIFDAPWRERERTKFIVHHQASRRLKEQVRRPVDGPSQ